MGEGTRPGIPAHIIGRQHQIMLLEQDAPGEFPADLRKLSDAGKTGASVEENGGSQFRHSYSKL